MYTVSQLAKKCSVTPDAVRFYTKKGLLSPAKDPRNNYQKFGLDDVSRLNFIRQAKLLGYTLSEIEEILHHSMKQNSPCPIVREFIQRRIEDNQQKIKALTLLQKRMKAALKDWEHKPNGIPDGSSICHLIESFSEDT